jgi:hypothetical protein
MSSVGATVGDDVQPTNANINAKTIQITVSLDNAVFIFPLLQIMYIFSLIFYGGEAIIITLLF